MALNFLPFLNNPVRKPTGHEPFSTFTEKFNSLAQNYHGLPTPVDPRPVFAGADKGPRALMTMPHRPPPANRSDLPLPFTTVVYNANAMHVPDLMSMAEDEGMRRKEAHLYAVAKAYVPLPNAGMSMLYATEIASLQGRINEIRAQGTAQGADPVKLEAMLAEEYAHLRELLSKQEMADSGVSPTSLRVERMLMASANVPASVAAEVARRRAPAAAAMGVPAAPVVAQAEVAGDVSKYGQAHDATEASLVADALALQGSSGQKGVQGGPSAITVQNGTPSATGKRAANADLLDTATPAVPPSTADSGRSATRAILMAQLASTPGGSFTTAGIAELRRLEGGAEDTLMGSDSKSSESAPLAFKGRSPPLMPSTATPAKAAGTATALSPTAKALARFLAEEEGGKASGAGAAGAGAPAKVKRSARIAAAAGIGPKPKGRTMFD